MNQPAEPAKKTRSSWASRNFWWFVALTYLITWAIWVPLEILAVQRGYILPNPQTLIELFKTGFQDSLHLALSILMVFIAGPLLAAIIVIAFQSGKPGLADLWRRSVLWRIGSRWYLVILAILLVIYLPVAIVGLVRGPLPTAGQLFAPLVWVVPWFLMTLIGSGLEEPGWRGYALPTLQKSISAKKASLLIGVVWGIWHWPVFIPLFTSILNSEGGSLPAALITSLIQLVLYVFGAILGEVFIYTWLYNRTGSVWICILFHTLHNMLATYIGIILPGAVAILPMLGGVMQWIVAIVLLQKFWVEPASRS